MKARHIARLSRRVRLGLLLGGLAVVALGAAVALTLAPPRGMAAPGATPTAPASAATEGRRLFIAKGCATCHAHAALADGPARPYPNMEQGPPLTSHGRDAAYLRVKLRDPALLRGTSSATFAMPDLGLSDAEIEALVAFLTEGQDR